MIILAIESSCDETSVAITDERKILSNIVATQIAEHKIYGGVVPDKQSLYFDLKKFKLSEHIGA